MMPGRLRHRVMVQEATESLDSHGQSIHTWADKRALWAEVRASSAAERVQFEKVKAKTKYTAVIRHAAWLTKQMRLSYGALTLDIDGILPDRTDARMQRVLCFDGDQE